MSLDNIIERIRELETENAAPKVDARTLAAANYDNQCELQGQLLAAQQENVALKERLEKVAIERGDAWSDAELVGEERDDYRATMLIAKNALCTARYLIQYNAKIGTPSQADRWNREYDAHYPECCVAITAIDTTLAKYSREVQTDKVGPDG